MLLFILLTIVFAGFYYIQAWQYGLGPKRWAVLGLLFGPLLLPMFRTHKRMRILKAKGPEGISFRA